MYHILNFYTIIFSVLLSKINSKIVKFEMIVLTGREKTDADSLNFIACCWNRSGREGERKLTCRERE
jgi:hypothetical protein